MTVLKKVVKNLSKTTYLLDKNDYEQYRDLFFYSFDEPESDAEKEFLKREFEHSKVYGIKADGQLQVSITCVPFKVNFFGKEFDMSGIANVMSAPEYMQSNGVDTLMDQAFTDMYRNGTTLSYLGPFSYDYYRRFGYEQVFENLKITMPFTKLARYSKPSMGRLKRYKYSQAQDVIGDLFASVNTSGTVARKTWWWKNLALWYPNDLLAVYYDATDEVRGYMRYTFHNGTFIVQDMYYQTPDAFLGLMHFINKHRSIYKDIVINSTDTSLRINNFSTNPTDAKVEIKPAKMARIVDIKKFFTDYPVQVDNIEPINLEVNDSLSWNNHIWTLSVKDGVVNIEKSDSEIPEVIVDIQTLTKAMFGYQSLTDSFKVGNVLGNTDEIETLDKLFVHEKAQLKDFF